MTEKEAIEIIKYASAFNSDNSPLTKALDMAIKALEKQIQYKVLEEQCITECGCGLNMIVQKYNEFLEHIHELAGYWELEQKGLLRRLPCNLGDVIYILAGRLGTFYEKDICDGYYIGWDGILQVKVQNKKGNHSTYGVIGENAFLTKEEAEAALKKM